MRINSALRHLAAFAALILASRGSVARAQGPTVASRQARNCFIDIDTAERYRQEPAPGGQHVYAGGIFKAHCRDQPTTMVSDSLEWFSERGELHLIGRAHFKDSVQALDADRLTYWTRQEHLYAEGHVFMRNTSDGSELRGPNMDYYRAVPPIRDTLELLASGRPTIRLQPARDTVQHADTTNPFVIIADRVKLRHNDRFWGSGNVRINRRDLRARSDSAQLDTADSLAWLIGVARVEGLDTTRAATDTSPAYILVGQRIRFDLGDRQDVRRVRSYGDADARGADWHLTADTIDMRVDSGKIQRAQAWGRDRRPVAVSGLSTIVADSMDILLPAQVMKQVWAFRAARAVSRPDSTAPEDDWISGDSLRATFVRTDSAGATHSDPDRVDAYGSARALYHTDNEQDPRGTKGINYSRGRRIDIALRQRRVRLVDIVGQVDGVYLEPMAPVRDTSRLDSTRADTTRRDTSAAARRDSTHADTSAARPGATPTAPAPTSPTPATTRVTPAPPDAQPRSPKARPARPS